MSEFSCAYHVHKLGQGHHPKITHQRDKSSSEIWQWGSRRKAKQRIKPDCFTPLCPHRILANRCEVIPLEADWRWDHFLSGSLRLINYYNLDPVPEIIPLGFYTQNNHPRDAKIPMYRRNTTHCFRRNFCHGEA